MKEELKALKGSTEQIVNARKGLLKQILFFNMKVEEQKQTTNTEELFNHNNNSYEAAKELNFMFPEVHEIVLIIRTEHPKYGSKRIKDLVLKKFAEKADTLVKDESLFEALVDNYLMYESCGFFKLLEQEKELDLLEDEAKEATVAILDESKEAAIKAGKAALNIVKPYGEVAKSQLNDAGDAAKKVINKGSQKLKRFFESIEEKTKTK